MPAASSASSSVESDDAGYRAQVARRRQLIGAFLLIFFLGVPVLMFLITHALFYVDRLR